MDPVEVAISVADLIVKLVALTIGGIWALYKINEHRELKNWVQLSLEANIYKLAQPESARARTWTREGDPVELDPRPYTHAIEILLRFTNKGKTRARIFNIQVAVNTMRAPGRARFDEGDGHLHLTRIHTSGNLVPELRVEGMPVAKTSFYYFEPEVEQEISYLCLVSQPRELVQVFAMFSLEQERLFPKTIRRPRGMYPHTAARTFQLAPDGQMQAQGDAT